MRAHEYIQLVTEGIPDPVRAADVRRELQAHVDQTVEELAGKPIDDEAAELIAVARMGPPEGLARQLTAVHRGGLPWRHYLSVIPIGCLVAMFFIWDAPSDYWRVGVRWLAVLIICLMPGREALVRLYRLLKSDVTAKWAWLERQELRSAALVGGPAGVVAGVVWAAISPLWDHLWERWGDLFRQLSVTYHPNALLQIGLPLLAASVVGVLLRRSYSGPWTLPAAISGLTFPLGFLPVYFVWGWHVSDWTIMTMTLQIVYALSAILVGAIAEAVRSRGRLFPVR